ncbi:MAG: hypothetical protein ACOZAN_04220 [Patescibacteria group bacterium]
MENETQTTRNNSSINYRSVFKKNTGLSPIKISIVFAVILLAITQLTVAIIIYKLRLATSKTDIDQSQTKIVKDEPMPYLSDTDEFILFASYQDFVRNLSISLTPQFSKEISANGINPQKCLSLFKDNQHQDMEYQVLKPHIKDHSFLIKGLDTIDEFLYSLDAFTETEDGKKIKETTKNQQNIAFNNICLDEKNSLYYVLYLTTGAKKNVSIFNAPQAQAAGGWSGYSNLAIIDFKDPYNIETDIFENIDRYQSKLTAYNSCAGLIGKSKNNLYVSCGGEGATSVLKVETDTKKVTELSYCAYNFENSLTECFDKDDKKYFEYSF